MVKIADGAFIRQLLILFAFFILFMPHAMAEEEDEMPTLSSCSNDFTVAVDLPNAEKTGSGYLINDVATFLISCDDSRSGQLYTLYYFLGDRVKTTKEEIALPYSFKRTYRGIAEQMYQLNFMLKDDEGKCGVASVIINVTH